MSNESATFTVERRTINDLVKGLIVSPFNLEPFDEAGKAQQSCTGQAFNVQPFPLIAHGYLVRLERAGDFYQNPWWLQMALL
jgi:hypothetical protein